MNNMNSMTNADKTKSTLHIGEAGGHRVLVPNDVPYHDDAVVVFDNKAYEGFYISYNNHDTDIYKSDTTALVLGQMEFFFILNGNHADGLCAAAKKDGFAGCMEYIRKHSVSVNSEYSDYKPGKEDAAP